jgi:hypothetical protein
MAPSRPLLFIAFSIAPLPAIAVACSSSRSTETPTEDNASLAQNDAGVGALSAQPATPCKDYNALKNVYWGDLHTHTSLSADAYGFSTRNAPIDAYEFAMGATKTIAAASDAGFAWKLPKGRALDWDAITDHSEWLAVAYGCGQLLDGGAADPASPYYPSTECANYRAAVGKALPLILARAKTVIADECDAGTGTPTGQTGQCLSVTASAWQKEQQAAAAANLRCTFTSLVGYEWTASSDDGGTLHHNVIFGTDVVPAEPFDFLDYHLNTDLWTALDNWKKTDSRCATSGACAAITIPHNSNQSNGLAFDVPDDANAIDQMSRYQTLVEIHQHKGNSECYPGPGSTDPTCNFEQLSGQKMPQNYVRYALGQGIKKYAAARDAGQADAANPLKMGIVGATDDHNGMPGDVAEDAWPGHAGDNDDSPDKRLGSSESQTFNPGGITAVWAEQNTRDRIFAALTRRESFATSGPRITVRFYQTWNGDDFCSQDGGTAFPKNVLQAGGVPMGGDVPALPSGAQYPQLVVSATKDVNDLAEVDIVKLSVKAGTLTNEVKRFTVSGGAACIGWIDDGFDPQASTVYYARVLEAPSPRWSSYDCAALDGGPSACSTLPATIQERAWTSPIWWQP